MTADPSPFSDLPAALVEEVLQQTREVATQLLQSFEQIGKDRQQCRRELQNRTWIVPESNLPYPPSPTTCAADGSYAVERLLTTDMVAAAAVAVEGLTPPSEKRHWPLPRHTTFVAAEPHLEDTVTVLRAVMLGEELELLRKAPHDLVLLDGTLTLPIIFFNQALNALTETQDHLRCAQKFIERCETYLEAYLELLQSPRSDKQYAAVPKYSTRREIGRELGWPDRYDDRGLLTLLLNPGELTAPRELEQPRNANGEITWHLNTNELPPTLREPATELASCIIAALQHIRVFYYRPHPWLPALRIEVSAAIADNPHRLATVIQGLKQQCVTPSMLEPYPLYLADRIVKALARALPTFRQVTTQQISEEYKGDVSEVFFAMHGYRSDSGK